MPVSASILADSFSPSGKRLTSFLVECPVYVWTELLTHRLLSRSCSSTRAVPTAKFLEDVRANPAIPTVLTQYQKGMSANQPLSLENEAVARAIYTDACNNLLNACEALSKLGVSKQDANILLLGFIHYRAIVTATEWKNFFKLRVSEEARPDMRLLATTMQNLYQTHTPNRVGYNEWHLPFDPGTEFSISDRRAVSIARCARVSYLKEGQLSRIEDDLALYERLKENGHLSPMEHIATPIPPEGGKEVMVGNFVGWLQYRKTVEGESGGDIQEVVHLNRNDEFQKGVDI